MGIAARLMKKSGVITPSIWGLCAALCFFTISCLALPAAASPPVAQKTEQTEQAPPPMIAPAPPPVPMAAPPASVPNSPSVIQPETEKRADREPIVLDKDQISAAQAEVRRSKDIQFDLPPVPLPKAEPKKTYNPSGLGDFIKAITPFLRVIFWAAVAALVLYLLYMFVPAIRLWVDARLQRRAINTDIEPEDDWAQERSVARSLLQEADALAKDGQYAEAAHLLLWRSIEDIENRRPDIIRGDWTSREIASAPSLPGVVRDAFSTIARAVEISLFGKRPVTADNWADCRDAYARFAIGASWKEHAA
jgi:hypothetical protein